MILIIMYNTVMMVIDVFIKECSWKEVSCSTTDDAVSLIRANAEYMANTE